MTAKTNVLPDKKIGQVSLSKDFALHVRSHADAQGRSMAAQLEHWGKIAIAIENVIPAPALAKLKSGQVDPDIMARVGAYLMQPNPASLVAKLEATQLPRYGSDDARPGVVIRIDPDGTQTEGAFDAGGNFIPQPSSTTRSQGHEQRTAAKKPNQQQHRAVRRPPAQQKNKRVAEEA